jgi:poly(ADP-ribose) glycohydrolase ARH3
MSAEGATMALEGARVDCAAVRGSLLGAACGDALGAPFEGADSVSPALVEAWAASDRTFHHTDDTAMTLVLARHLVESGGAVDVPRLAEDFAREWQTDPHRGYGAGPPRVFRAVLDGDDWAEVSRSAFGGAGSWGNGGAMRVAPVAFAPGSLAARVETARSQATVTHAHPLGQDGAALQCAAVAVAAARAGSVLDPGELLAIVDEHVRTPELREALEVVGDLVAAGSSAQEVADRLGRDISALGSVPTALALFLGCPDDVRAAVASAVQVGGDADTIASMVGALAGARCGEAALPSSWVTRLECAEAMAVVADSLCALRAV